MTIDFSLPYPPSLNTLYPTYQGRRLLSKKGRDYHQAVAEAIMLQKIGGGLAGRISLEVTLYPPDNRRRDISNCIKALEDSLTKAGVWLDDEQVDVLHVERAEVRKPGAALVKIREVVK